MMIIKKIIAAFLIVLILLPAASGDAKVKLQGQKKKRADKIASVCSKEWNSYGVLPSVAIAQAFVESTLGEHCHGNNLWGIRSGAVSYKSLTAGIYGYMGVINNRYYTGAPYQTSHKRQIRTILDGGYCQPSGSYYSNVMWTIERYNLREYDRKLFQSKNYYRAKFEVVYDKHADDYNVTVDKCLIKGAVVIQCEKKKWYGTYDVKSGQKGFRIGTNDKSKVGLVVFVDVFKKAKG